jgi:hypothetical protein
MTRTHRASTLLLLGLSLVAGPAPAYQNYDPATKPQGGPHRRINEQAWRLFVLTRIREAESPDKLLSLYQLKDTDYRTLTGPTVTTPGDWPSNLGISDVALTVPLWVAEGGYTADEPEIFACLRHFYDPTAPEGRRYLTDIPWVGRFREWVRSHWREDVELVNPEIDARDLAVGAGNNPYGWAAGLAAMRQCLGPGDASQAQRDAQATAAWRALGETMHLMADMCVPAHVRNDGHPGMLPAGELRPDPYEAWILAPEIDAAVASIPRTGNWQRLDFEAAMDDEIGRAIVGSSTPMALFHAVAGYTNKTFATPDTLTGTDFEGKPVTPINGHVYPAPVLGRELTYDAEAGTYNRDFQRRPTVYMIKATWQSNTWSSLARNLGITLAGGNLTFGTNQDCAMSQAMVLVPIAVAANVRLLDWYLPRFAVTITGIDATKPDKPLTGTVEHQAYGAWERPMEVTLAEDAPIDLYVDDKLQSRRDYELTVARGVLQGSLHGVDLAAAKRIWVVVDLAGLKVASPPYSPQGTVVARVCKPQDQVSMTNPMFVLGGEPIQGVEVVCSFVHQGKAQTLRAKTDKDGSCSFAVPLEVDVVVAAQGGERTVRCTADKPKAAAPFGWQGHDPMLDGVVDPRSGAE